MAKRYPFTLNDSSIPSLVTTRWDQTSPYNFYVEPYYTGCVPTATAQLMKYHNYPATGTGVIPGYESYPDLDIEEFKYQWDKMPDVLNSSSGQDQVTATADLIFHIGRALKCHFDYGTSANTNDVSALLQKYYSYDKYDYKIDFDDKTLAITPAEIKPYILNELRLGRPVLVGIIGHAVVCTGYNQEKDTFIFNWGWAEDDFEYALSDKYLSLRSLHCGLRPAVNEILYVENLESSEISFHPGGIYDVEFTLGSLNNVIFEGSVFICLTDKNGFIREMVSEKVSLSISEEKRVSIQVSLPEEVTLGDRFIQVYYESSAVEFRPVRGQNDEILNIAIKVSSLSSENVMLQTNLIAPGNIYEGESFVVSGLLSSMSDMSCVVGAFLCDDNNNIIYTLQQEMIDFSAEEPVKLQWEVSVPKDAAVVSHHYRIIFQVNHSIDPSEPAWRVVMGNEEDVISFANTYLIRRSTHKYDENYTLVSNLNNTNYVGIYQPYSTLIKVRYDEFATGVSYFKLAMINDNDEVVSSSDAYLVQTGGNAPNPAEYPVSLLAPEVYGNRNYNLCLLVAKLTSGILEFNLVTGTDEFVNPTPLLVNYTNVYEFIQLTNSISMDRLNLVANELFMVDATILLYPQHADKMEGTVADFSIILNDGKNDYNIGTTLQTYAARTVKNDLSIACKVSADIPPGQYSLRLQASNISGFADIHPVVYKVKGHDKTIIDELTVEII